jgi:3-deoxy-D-manno-octulosonate 8-phosphate phosphatase (KDO 8-P phosphatase)
MPVNPGVTSEAVARASRIRIALFDVDGVLTDGRLYYGPAGEALKVFHTLDGHGLKMLAESGVVTGLISGRRSEAVEARARELGMAHVFLGADDKLARLDELLDRLGIDASQCAFMGDDLPDLPVLRRCGFAVAVANAVSEVKACAHLVTAASGGNGAVREFCDFVMQARGTPDGAVARHRA